VPAFPRRRPIGSARPTAVCGNLPPDNARAAVLRFDRPRPKRSAGVYRVNDARRQRDQLIRSYVDSETGLVDELRSGGVGGLATVAARLGVASRRTDVAGYGRSAATATAS